MADVVNFVQDMRLDAESLETFLNGDDATEVLTRLGENYPSLQKLIKTLIESGLVGAQSFKTYAELILSELPVDSYAIVASDTDEALNGIYQKGSTGWVLSKYNPIIQMMSKLRELGYDQVVHDGSGNAYHFAMVNQILGQIIWGMSDTSFVMPNHVMQVDDIAGFSIQDKYGRSAMNISGDGSLFIPNLQSPVISELQAKAESLSTLGVGWNRKDINHVIIYGQSLSDGSVASTGETSTGNEISTTQPYANVMLAGGTRAEPQHSFYSTSFAPLVEQSLGQFSDSSNTATYNTSQNESPVAGTCNEFTRRCLANSQKAVAENFVMAGTASGAGGQNVEALISGRQWPILEQHIKDVAGAASTQSKTEAVAAIVYIQGEANHHAILRDLNSFDSDITADIYEYQQRVEQLIKKIDSVAIANCPNQDYLPYVFTYQTEAHRSYDYTDTTLSLNENPIATAQWFASKSNERVVLAIPAYALAKNNRDKVHLTHVASWLMGAYIARAMEHTMHRKQGKWRPLEPTHWNWTDTHCDISFYVPCGELVIDNFFCPTQPNKGFDVWINKTLQSTAISSVTLLDRKTVRVTFTAPQPSNAQLSYCLGREETKPNAFGNLRDTHGDSDSVTDPLGNIHKLHNPSVMFNIHKTRGFV